MKKLLVVLIVIGVLLGVGELANGSVYYNIKSKVIEYRDTTKDWTIKYGGIATDWTVKHSIIVKDGIVYYANNEILCDMLYLAGDGFTFGLVLDNERCKDIIRRHPVSGRIIAISSRVIAVYIVSRVATEITYYVIRSFARGGVYVEKINGIVNYVGRTNNFTRRGVEWAKEGRIITPVYRTPFLCEQRAFEQTLINRFGITNLANKINSISP